VYVKKEASTSLLPHISRCIKIHTL